VLRGITWVALIAIAVAVLWPPEIGGGPTRESQTITRMRTILNERTLQATGGAAVEPDTLDAWGTKIVIEHADGRALQARSAGADRALHTADDIVIRE
jgi:hypothetical protein